MTPAPLRSSLARVLEPEVMDSTDEARDYDAMDHGEVNRRFVDDLLAAQGRWGVRDERARPESIWGPAGKPPPA